MSVQECSSARVQWCKEAKSAVVQGVQGVQVYVSAGVQ